MTSYFENNPDYKKTYDQFWDHEYNKTQYKSANEVRVIPVHVIIVHHSDDFTPGRGSNLSMAHINSQIDVLNKDFRSLNSATSQVPDVFTPFDTQIEFCLARVDPDGNETNGVTRVRDNRNFSENEMEIKLATGWDNREYLNIWVTHDIGSPGLLGYAYLPSPSEIPSRSVDGCVVADWAFGGPAYSNLNGQTTTHEVGHYLGLPHIWGGGCGRDDGFADTPDQEGATTGCPTHPATSCGNQGNNFHNFMDYSDERCQSMFSGDQSNYMNHILNTSRKQLVTGYNFCDGPPESLTLTSVILDSILCPGEATATVEIKAIGGYPPYEYGLGNRNFQTETIFHNIGPGTHTVTIRDSERDIFRREIEVPDASGVDLIIVNENTIDVSCYGDSDGSIELTAQGTEDIMYSLDSLTNNDTGIFTDLSAGDYDIMVSSPHTSCVRVVNFTVEQNDSLSMQVDVTNDSGSGDGSITITAAGGLAPYQYEITGSESSGPAESPIFENLNSEEYLVTVIDANGCTATQRVMVPLGTGLGDIGNSGTTFSLSPVPFYDKLRLKIDLKTPHSTIGVEVIDISGKIVFDQRLTEYTSSISKEIDLSSLQSGAYFVRITANGESGIQKIIKL